MGSRTLGLRIAGVVFGLVALAQLFRLLTRVEILVANHALPLWPNAIAFLIAGGLCAWLWWLSYRGSE